MGQLLENVLGNVRILDLDFDVNCYARGSIATKLKKSYLNDQYWRGFRKIVLKF